MAAFDPTLDVSRTDGLSGHRPVVDMPMLAHDIRGALQGVVGGVAALERAPLSLELAEQVARISAASRSLESLIGMALDPLTGADEAAGDDDGERTDLDDFLDDFRSRWAGEAHGLGRKLVISRGRALPHGLRLPHLSLARMIGNLTLNAILHGGRGTIDVALGRSESGGLVLRVADEGPGLPPAVIRRLFATADGPEAALPDARGLGLRIVRDLAARLGCEFSLRNRSRGGAEATLVVPASLCIEEEIAISGSTAPGEVFPELAGLRVLLGEDNQTNQMVATQMLNALNVQVEVASDGVETLERFEQGDFDLVLVDIEMPRLSGLDVIRRIRARDDARASIPILALTAYALREHRDRIAEAGADGLISKPITSVEALALGLKPHAAASATAQPLVSDAAASTVIDRQIYDALSEAIGADLMEELLGKVISDLENARAGLANARSPVDREAIRQASHILISVSGAIGATRLQTCAGSLNAAARGAIYQTLETELVRCIREIDAALDFVRGEQGAD